MNKSRIPIKSHNISNSSTSSSSRAMAFPSNSSTTENIEQPKRFFTESTPISWMSEEPEDNDEDLKPTREDGSRDDPSDNTSNNSSSDEGDEDLLQGLIKQAWAPKSHKAGGHFGANTKV